MARLVLLPSPHASPCCCRTLPQYDYVGAPWHRGNERWGRAQKRMPHGVGNGGLSLRSVPAMMALARQHGNNHSNAQQVCARGGAGGGRGELLAATTRGRRPPAASWCGAGRQRDAGAGRARRRGGVHPCLPAWLLPLAHTPRQIPSQPHLAHLHSHTSTLPSTRPPHAPPQEDFFYSELMEALPEYQLPPRQQAYQFCVEVPCDDIEAEAGGVARPGSPVLTLPGVPMALHATW